MVIGLISDTHGRLDNEVFDYFEGVDLIAHAGDIGGHPLDPDELLSDLSAIAPVQAVSGNVDGFESSGHPMWRVFSHPLGNFGITHRAIEGGRKVGGIDQSCAERELKILLYGHSHVPRVHSELGTLWINPGSAGPKRFQLPRSMAKAQVDEAAGTLSIEYYEMDEGRAFQPEGITGSGVFSFEPDGSIWQEQR